MKVDVEILREVFSSLVSDEGDIAILDRAIVSTLIQESKGETANEPIVNHVDPKQKFRERGLKAAETRRKRQEEALLASDSGIEGALNA